MKKLFLILAATLAMTVACQKDDTDATPQATPQAASNSLTISINGKTYTHTNLNAAFFYDEDNDGYNINFAPENISQIVVDAIANNKDIGYELDSIASTLFDIDIPKSAIGKTHTLSPELKISTDSWSLYTVYMNKAEDAYFSCFDGSFKSGTMRVDLDKETGKLTVNLDAVVDDESEITIKMTFEGNAYQSPCYMWSL